MPIEFRRGSKKLYWIEANGGQVLVDCDATGLMMRIPVPEDKIEAIVNRTSNIQDLLPDMDKAVRETLISGTTPAEWKDMVCGPKLPRAELERLGYDFSEE